MLENSYSQLTVGVFFILIPSGLIELKNKSWQACFLVSLAAGFLLFGYECVRSPANTLFKASYGSEALAYAMAVMPIAIAVLVGAYTYCLKKTGPRYTLFISSVVSAVAIFGLQRLYESGFLFASAILLFIRESYVVLLIEQYWSFLNSTMKHEEAKRWNGPICGVASVLSTAGGFFVAKVASDLGTTNLLSVGAFSIIPATVLCYYAFKIAGEPKDEDKTNVMSKDSTADNQIKNKFKSGLFEIYKHRRLQFIFLSVFLSQASGAMLDLAFQTELQTAIPQQDLQTSFSGAFFGYLNLASLLSQFILAPYLLRFFEGRFILIALAFFYFIPASVAFFIPGLWSVAAALFILKTCDYSIFRVAKEIVYQPLSFTARYRSKEIIDVFGYRASKGISTAALIGAKKYSGGASALGYFHYIGAACVLLGIWVVASIPYARSLESKPD